MEEKTSEKREDAIEVVTMETLIKREETVETEAVEGAPEQEVVTTPVERELEVTMETVEAEAISGKEITIEMETPEDAEQAKVAEVVVETGDTMETAVETAPTTPSMHGAGGEYCYDSVSLTALPGLPSLYEAICGRQVRGAAKALMG